MYLKSEQTAEFEKLKFVFNTIFNFAFELETN